MPIFKAKFFLCWERFKFLTDSSLYLFFFKINHSILFYAQIYYIFFFFLDQKFILVFPLFFKIFIEAQKSKKYSCKKRLEKFRLTTLQERKMKDDLIETFEIINGISTHSRHFLNIFPQTGNLLSRKISKAKSAK